MAQHHYEIVIDVSLGFGAALAALRSGARVQRLGWNGRGMWLALVEPTPTSDMTTPYIMMSTADGEHVPWVASQIDLLADDWQEVAP